MTISKRKGFILKTNLFKENRYHDKMHLKRWWEILNKTFNIIDNRLTCVYLELSSFHNILQGLFFSRTLSLFFNISEIGVCYVSTI